LLMPEGYGVGAREGFEVPDPVEGLDDLIWVRPANSGGKRVRESPAKI
jgi:hypothetical protein